MIDLAENGKDGYVTMSSVSERQEISLKYLEKIMPSLVKAGYVSGVHGKGGGYRLAKDPSEYTVGEILRLAEGEDLAPVACLDSCAEACSRAQGCKTLPMWKKLYKLVNDFFDGITLADLM